MPDRAAGFRPRLGALRGRLARWTGRSFQRAARSPARGRHDCVVGRAAQETLVARNDGRGAGWPFRSERLRHAEPRDLACVHNPVPGARRIFADAQGCAARPEARLPETHRCVHFGRCSNRRLRRRRAQHPSRARSRWHRPGVRPRSASCHLAGSRRTHW